MPELLYFQVPQYLQPAKGLTINAAFCENLKKSEYVQISTGYFSRASLKKLDQLIHEEDCALKKIDLLLGMYGKEGMREIDFNYLCWLNKKWRQEGIGKILIPRLGTNHEKVYLFHQRSKIDKELYPFMGIVGSANLSFLRATSSNYMQYETAVLIDPQQSEKEEQMIQELGRQMNEVLSKSVEFDKATIQIKKEPNKALKQIKGIKETVDSEIEKVKDNIVIETKFFLPLKVPRAADRMKEKTEDGQSTFIKSNINVCYAEPRNKKAKNIKYRNWYEMQLCVSVQIRKDPNYPKGGEPFIVLTDDGYRFLAHTESQNFKQLSAIGNEQIMGRWLKGRLVAAGLVESVEDPYLNDPNRNSMITQEMLEEYGATHLLFGRTNQKEMDDQGRLLDVWYLSFNPAEIETS